MSKSVIAYKAIKEVTTKVDKNSKYTSNNSATTARPAKYASITKN